MNVMHCGMKMKKIGYTGVLLLTVFTLFASAALTNNAYAGSLNLVFGEKSLDKDDWEPLESQSEFGIIYEFSKPEERSVAVVVSLLRSKDSMTETETFDDSVIDFTTTAETTELGIGARKYFTENRARPFVEGGLAYVLADVSVEGTVVSTSPGTTVFPVIIEESIDPAVGFWFGIGLDVKVGEAWSVGLLGRLTNANGTFSNEGEEIKIGGTHLAVFTAYHFGK